MNHSDPKKSRPKSSAGNGDDRDLFVVDDFHSIPASELRHMVSGTGAWIKAILARKLGRSKSLPTYAIELRRMTKSKHIPKRMEKYFESLRSKLEALSFSPNFEAAIPAVGPYVAAIVAMSRRDGDIHFIAHRATRQTDGNLIDEGDFRFISWLADGGILVTTTRANLPQARVGVDLLAVASEDPSVVLKRHRERMRQHSIENASPNELFDRLDAENRRETEDLLRRNVIRLATPAEVTRIRTELRV